MRVIFNQFTPGENIPVNEFIQNRKMAKYYNRETQAALVTIGMLLKGIQVPSETPIFYATGIVEHEEYELDKIAVHSVDGNGKFSNQQFIEKGMMQISPLTQFKVLYNMTLCFISIEYNLKGDNAALYSSAQGLINSALYSNKEDEILIGAGKIYATGAVESGFALVSKKEIAQVEMPNSETEAIEIFRKLNQFNSGN